MPLASFALLLHFRFLSRLGLHIPFLPRNGACSMFVEALLPHPAVSAGRIRGAETHFSAFRSKVTAK